MNQDKKKISPILIIIAVAAVAIVALLFVKGRGNNQPPITESQTGKPEISEPDDTLLDESALSESEIQTVSVEGGSFYFKPNDIKVKKGERVKIMFNSKAGSHNFVLDEFNVQTQETDSGKTTEAVFTPDKTGTFEFYCSIGNHRSLGMKGNLIVVEK